MEVKEKEGEGWLGSSPQGSWAQHSKSQTLPFDFTIH